MPDILGPSAPESARCKLLILLCGLLLVRRLRRAHRRSAAGGLAGLQTDLGHQLALAGPADGAYVYDVTAKQALFSERASTLAPAASVEKLYTATTALDRDGSDGPPDDNRLRGRAPRSRRDLGRQPLSARRRRSDLRQQLLHRPPLRRRGHQRLHARRPSSSAPRASITSPARCWATSRSSTPCGASPRAATPPTRSWKARSAALAFNRGATGGLHGAACPRRIRRARAVGSAESRRRQHPRPQRRGGDAARRGPARPCRIAHRRAAARADAAAV